MTEQLLNIVLGLSGFLLFAAIQSLIINGIKEAMGKGMILSGFSNFIERTVKSEYWRKPLNGCIKCLASTGGGITFWPFVLLVFGWHWEELLIFVADVFTLVTLNWYIYKKL